MVSFRILGKFVKRILCAINVKDYIPSAQIENPKRKQVKETYNISHVLLESHLTWATLTVGYTC